MQSEISNYEKIQMTTSLIQYYASVIKDIIICYQSIEIAKKDDDRDGFYKEMVEKYETFLENLLIDITNAVEKTDFTLGNSDAFADEPTEIWDKIREVLFMDKNRKPHSSFVSTPIGVILDVSDTLANSFSEIKVEDVIVLALEEYGANKEDEEDKSRVFAKKLVSIIREQELQNDGNSAPIELG